MTEPIAGTLKLRFSRQARERYHLSGCQFSEDGQILLADLRGMQALVMEINQQRGQAEASITAGQVNALASIDEILLRVFRLYQQQINPLVLHQALQWLQVQAGAQALEDTLLAFVDAFPPQAADPQEYLAGATGGIPNREIVLEGIIQLWLDNANPAAAPLTGLFDDSPLEKRTAYLQLIHLLQQFFDSQPKFGLEQQNLLEMLRAPAAMVPMSLTGQLQYIREKWAFLLGSNLARVLAALDRLQEEEKPVFAGPGPAKVLQFSGMEDEGEPEFYSTDQDWMPGLVLIAKSSYVWLDQLSRKYRREIRQLDQIPDAELDQLAAWGISGLWLIGLWERSRASQRIKQLTGNPEAVASAYSLLDYQIAADLGGEAAYQNLAARAWQRGIRLASDMVPNHMGIDSTWVIEHPDWFLHLPDSPFPSYTFEGPDLSSDERVGIYLEDHYYNRSDAAVVFKRVDRSTGETAYLYHGNDGTSMPWNDTAQLDYLNPEVREAVIRVILDVARKFPVIRFDAAMTLAKRHIQRLWFPEPGSGGAIASRSEHAMSKAQFNTALPGEFWREVVQRVAKEVPNTLLLAEAFWMMEGYFVRSLGMNRVYNSAFMHMLKNEDNAGYRTSIKNVLEFDPEILKRFVNFMNNPDEESAAAQFGKDDRYFGVCTLMVTLPGLPMIGHGQIEGYREKYGMEYRRAYWDELPDDQLLDRHQREIFPLLKRRAVFAGVRNFLLYDLVNPDGSVNENVFAYSNSAGETLAEPGERGLVIYNNKYADARGRIHNSAACAEKKGPGEKVLVTKTLGEGLGLHPQPGHFCIMREQNAGLEYITSSVELCEQGLPVTLGAFKSLVYLDIREVIDDETGQYSRLAALLAGRGTPGIEAALREMNRPKPAETGAGETPVKRTARASGILLHPTSLPGRFGIGDLGDGAYQFIDFLQASRQRYWQVMPLGPTSYGDSPYQALSAFAGNPLLINLERLVDDRLLMPWDFDNAPSFSASQVDYGAVIQYKDQLLRRSYETFKKSAGADLQAELQVFAAANAGWLDDFALFAALKEYHGGARWDTWEPEIAAHRPEAVARWRVSLEHLVGYYKYAQFLFYRQWSALKSYANERGVRIIGDIPIFVALDSADVWAHQDVFYIDEHRQPSLVAGVPPDFFSPTGQLWGNPLYRWDVMAEDGFAWWTARFAAALSQVDIIRIDHFRGFEACWAVPASEPTAVNGQWMKVPGLALFQTVEQALGRLPVIAEDLGLITPEVEALREAAGFPGMKVLQFAFAGGPEHRYLPHMYSQNCVVYTGTHDNDTTMGWYHSANEQERSALHAYIGTRGEVVNWAVIRLAFLSVADTAIIPLQDVLGIGSEGRMNRPGQAAGNWTWRYTPEMLAVQLCERLKIITEVYGRAAKAAE